MTVEIVTKVLLPLTRRHHLLEEHRFTLVGLVEEVLLLGLFVLLHLAGPELADNPCRDPVHSLDSLH